MILSLKNYSRNICNKISNLGIIEEQTIYKKKRLIAFNRLNVFGLLLSIIWFFYTTHKSTFATPFNVLLNILPTLIILFSFALVYFKKHKIAIFATTIFIPLALSLATIEIKEGSVLLYLIIYAIFPFFFYTRFSKITLYYFFIAGLYGFALYFIEKNYVTNQFVFSPFMQVAELLFLYAILFTVKVQVLAYEKSLKRNKEIIKIKNNELTRLMILKDQILTTISHDVIVPLASIKTITSEIALNNLSHKEIEELFPLVVEEVTKAHDLFTNLLEWSKAQLNGNISVTNNLLIFNVAHKAIDHVQLQAVNKAITINNNIDKNTQVNFNENNLQIALRNIIANAVKFTPNNGNITIWEKQDEDGLKIYIKDDGVGMTKEIADKIFTHHSESIKGTNQETGNGFGLKISKELIEQNGGDLYCKSTNLGNGSTFVVSLPSSKKIINLAAV